MKKFHSVMLAGLAVIAALGALTSVLLDADASSPPVIPGDSAGPLKDLPLVVAPQTQEPDPYYYKFGPYVFPPVLRVHEQPALYEQPAPPPSPGMPAEPQHDRYYCDDSKAYYPQVQTCATPWRPVIPHASPKGTPP